MGNRKAILFYYKRMLQLSISGVGTPTKMRACYHQGGPNSPSSNSLLNASCNSSQLSSALHSSYQNHPSSPPNQAAVQLAQSYGTAASEGAMQSSFTPVVASALPYRSSYPGKKHRTQTLTLLTQHSSLSSNSQSRFLRSNV